MFRRRSRQDTISTLYGTIVAQARLPRFYRDYGVADTVDGRFDLLVLHLALIVDRLAEDEIVEIWATQIENGAAEALKAARSGSHLELIPDKVLDNYRRKSARRSPFGAGRSGPSSEESPTGGAEASAPMSEVKSA